MDKHSVNERDGLGVWMDGSGGAGVGGLNVNWAQDFIWRCHKLQLKYNPRLDDDDDGGWPAGAVSLCSCCFTGQLSALAGWGAEKGFKWQTAVIYSVLAPNRLPLLGISLIASDLLISPVSFPVHTSLPFLPGSLRPAFNSHASSSGLRVVFVHVARFTPLFQQICMCHRYWLAIGSYSRLLLLFLDWILENRIERIVPSLSG